MVGVELLASFTTGTPRAQVASERPPYQQWSGPKSGSGVQFFRTAAGYLVRFPGFADFEVLADSGAVECWPVPGASDAVIQHLFLNQVSPLVLSRTGRLMFHASAVALGDYCVAFMGESGRGKSTLAASFATAGHSFLTDDGLSLTKAGESFLALPSHPSLRLWTDSRAAVLGNAVVAAAVPGIRKDRFPAGEALAFCGEPRILRAIYLLGGSSAESVAFGPLAPGEALIELVKHSFVLDIEAEDILASHFDELATLVNFPICYRLDYPRRFEHLAAIRSAVIDHAAKLQSSESSQTPGR